MIIKIEFSKPQRLIIREICETQLSSLKRLQTKDSDKDVQLILIQYGANQEDFNSRISSIIDLFQEVFNNPDRLTILEDIHISIFRHILSQVEDSFLEFYPNAIKNLWKKLFSIEDFQLNKTSPSQLN